MSLVTVKSKFQVILPRSVREQMAIAPGDKLEARVEHGKITLTPASGATIEPLEFASAEGEYSEAQRREIDARLRKAEADPVIGPFKSGEEIAVFLKNSVPPNGTKQGPRKR